MKTINPMYGTRLKQQLTMKDGKFFKNGQFVPLEFGNKEQIAFIQKAEKILKAFESEDGQELDVSVETHYEGTIDFHCICGNHIVHSCTIDDENDFSNLTTVRTCSTCKKRYEIFTKSYHSLAVKFKNDEI